MKLSEARSGQGRQFLRGGQAGEPGAVCSNPKQPREGMQASNLGRARRGEKLDLDDSARVADTDDGGQYSRALVWALMKY